MSYQTVNIVVKSTHTELKRYFSDNCKLAKNMYNATLFRCRQILSASKKDISVITANELEVLTEFDLLDAKKNGQDIFIPNYYEFDKVLKVTNNPDYKNDLPSQCTQNVVKEALRSMKSFFAAIAEYKKNPSKFTAAPKLPRYIRTKEHGYSITNQDAKIKIDKNGTTKLKLPKTKLTINLGKCMTGRLIKVHIQPFYDTYKVSITTDVELTSSEHDKTRMLGIDLGVNNFVTTNNNCGLAPFIVNGKVLKAFNQWYNKTISKLQSCLRKSDTEQHISERMNRIYRKRKLRMEDFYNKTASYIIRYCIQNDIGVIVVGKNDGWKQSCNMGKENNQKFVQIAHSKFVDKLALMGEKYGVKVVSVEESYTSKSSLVDNDNLPTYDPEQEEKPTFLGKRVHRGLYRTADNIFLNADVNGAGNIIRKHKPNAFSKIQDMSYMWKTVNVVNIN